MKRIDRGETSSLIAFRLQPSLSLQIVTTVPPFQLKDGCFLSSDFERVVSSFAIYPKF